MTPNCDLHTHTLHSDGALAPAALVDLAASRGVSALAVTDHDTLDGLPAARRRGGERGLEVIPGIELSVQEEGRDGHLLGSFVSRGEALVEGVRLLRLAGAVPVMAHPGSSGCDDLLPSLRRAGVLGLEVWHPTHSAEEVRRYLRAAHRHGLLPTGGSDFHREAPGCTLP